ncbi:MAG: sigma-70 family RNA polymerase sigma factor [Verrucomicrobiota bacterium]|nr:sigma-70 family RNA polymerase sigma factor [Verrucomicrobiota bacterium]
MSAYDNESESSMNIYLREIGKISLLTVQDEIDLAALIKKGVVAQKKLKDAQKKSKSHALPARGIKPGKSRSTKLATVKNNIRASQEKLSAIEQKQLHIMKIAEDARQRMIKSNLRLVVKIAQDYTNCGLPLVDLISEGNIGLMKAVERFDPAKGGKLSTYGSWWIKQSIKRALANQSKTIRLPVHLVDKIGKMRRIAMRLSEELGREPTDEELAEEMQLPALKISRLRTAAIRPASLDAPISAEDTTVFGEIIGDESALTPYALLRGKQLRGDLDDLITILDEREKEIIFFRFGMDGTPERTLEEVGKKFHITRERVRQLQNIALLKMRKLMSKRERGNISIE